MGPLAGDSGGAAVGLLGATEGLQVICFMVGYTYQDLGQELKTGTLHVLTISKVNLLLITWASVLWFSLLSSNPQNQQFFFSPSPLALLDVAGPCCLLPVLLNWLSPGLGVAEQAERQAVWIEL